MGRHVEQEAGRPMQASWVLVWGGEWKEVRRVRVRREVPRLDFPTQLC